ncbi:MFS quinate transporter, putative [Talaromyces stipitatus ATCC 10500]|uniref:MFS quinate transporter, putative n=1 Tax=Talaromyces stipitatus (strain ATCC 10500 / CBS 375.48 / QM 6759 / NRRL 1006) TaxID=441959 RepID=B8LSS0_TALSN|nr:MFS quinate transporter, putative [Talaromyces stipitatus ATCC 10500]EED22916.1 MFS quinate transporter, putative [Talaromyces stipitatus ATCC 10500]
MSPTESNRLDGMADASTVPLLRNSSDLDTRSKQPPKSSFQARARLYWLAGVLCCGALLFGYDSGLIGGVLTFQSFHFDFRFGAYGPRSATTVSAIAVGTQQIGALIGCFAIWPINNLYGRRKAIGVCSIVFCIGVVLELLNFHLLPIFYIGRVIAGFGVGGSSSVIPIYLSEMAPKEIRGEMGSCFQFMFTIGIFISYWIDYAVGFMPPQTAQWQIPVALQLVPGGLMGFGVLTLHESVRWLVSNGDIDGARQSLEWIRAVPDDQDHETLLADEMADIRHGIEEEQAAKEGFSFTELLEWSNAHRILLAVGIFLAQQSTGATAMAYFGPQFFALIVGPGDKTFLLTGIFGFIKVVSCGLFIVVLSDRFGRRRLLFTGAALMAISMFTTAALVRASHLGHPSVHPSATKILTIALIYFTIIVFNLSWGPLPWPYVSEIFPTRIRESGVACGVGSQWLFNLIWSSATPYLLAEIGGWGTFCLFGGMCLGVCLFVIFALKETVNKTLEEINSMF